MANSIRTHWLQKKKKEQKRFFFCNRFPILKSWKELNEVGRWQVTASAEWKIVTGGSIPPSVVIVAFLRCPSSAVEEWHRGPGPMETDRCCLWVFRAPWRAITIVIKRVMTLVNQGPGPPLLHSWQRQRANWEEGTSCLFFLPFEISLHIWWPIVLTPSAPPVVLLLHLLLLLFLLLLLILIRLFLSSNKLEWNGIRRKRNDRELQMGNKYLRAKIAHVDDRQGAQ